MKTGEIQPTLERLLSQGLRQAVSNKEPEKMVPALDMKIVVRKTVIRI